MMKYTRAMKLLWNRSWKLEAGGWILRCLLLTAYCLLLFLTSCSPKSERLPIFGEREFNGKDTIYHTIATFRFVDQDSAMVSNATFKDKIYVADFFFTSCR